MKRIIEFAEKLISIPSTANDQEAINNILKVCLKELSSFKVKEFTKDGVKSLLFYNTESLPEKFKIILNGHLDVVEASDSQYKPVQKNGRLYGRGAYDMKTAVAVMISVFKDLAYKVDYPLGLQLVTDEEIGGFKGTKYQIEEGIKADFVIAGENTDLKINHKSKGIVWMKIKTKGKSAHGAYPWLGDNAIWKMHKALSIIEKNFPIPNREVWKTTVNLSMIETTNKTYNKVSDDCTAYLDIRYIPEDVKGIVKTITKQLEGLADIEVVLQEPSHSTKETNLYIKTLEKSINDVTKNKAELVSKHGASDIRHFNQINVEGVTFGPIGEGHHSDNEWVDLKSINDYYQILYSFLNHI